MRGEIHGYAAGVIPLLAKHHHPRVEIYASQF